MRKHFLFFTFVLITCFSCNRGPKHNLYENNFSGLMEHKTEKGFFRGISPGDSIEKVMRVEKPDYLLFSDSLVMRYRIMVSDSEFYDIDYSFYENKVNFIKFEAILPQIRNGDAFFTKLDKYFTGLCGPSEFEKGVYTWTSPDSITVELYDNSEEYGYGSILMYIYKSRDVLPDENDFLDSNLFMPA